MNTNSKTAVAKKVTQLPTARPLGPQFAELTTDLPEELRQIRSELSSLLAKQMQTIKKHLLFYYQIGLVVAKCRESLAAPAGDLSRTQQIGLLAESLKTNYHDLYASLRLVKLYSEEQYAALISNQFLTWSHVKHLIAVESQEERARLVALVVENHLSVNQLADEIIPPKPKLPRGPGRKPHVPRSLSKGLQRAIDVAKLYSNVFDNALFSDVYDIPSEIENVPPDELTVNVREKVASVVDWLAKVSDGSAKHMSRVKQALERIDKVIEVRAKAVSPVPPGDSQPGKQPARPGVRPVLRNLRAGDAQ